MVYAPVVITTMNRYTHLKRLIKSLQKNSWAKYTAIYIGVDYPNNPKYMEDYMKICAYLQSGINGFKEVNLFFHDANLGPKGNWEFLRNKISQKYDRYICAEDDNEFSPNFIEYIDKGLEKYKNDPSIIGICGHSHMVNWEIGNNALLKINCGYDTWGIGRWVEKDRIFFENVTISYLRGLLKNTKRAAYLYKVNPSFFSDCIRAVIYRKGVMFDKDGNFDVIDIAKSIYMIDSRCYYTLNPVLSKVRNRGDDGSGVHCGNNNLGCKQLIDQNEHFDYSNVYIYDNDSVIQKKMKSLFQCSSCEKIKTIIMWFLYKIGILDSELEI